MEQRQSGFSTHPCLLHFDASVSDIRSPRTQGRRYSGFWCYPCLGMNRSTKRELKIDIPLAILLALLPLAYENLDLPHSRTLAFITWGVCLLPAARIVWILWVVSVSRTEITFKEASAFTWWRRQVIKHDIAGMHAYFTGLEIPVPDKFPPFTVIEERQTIFTPPHLYRGNLNVPLHQITDRRAVTHVYAVYVMLTALPDPTKSPAFWNSIPDSLIQLNQTTFFSTDLREYFHASYWNSVNPETGLPAGAAVLWKIRGMLGRAFADKLASKVFRVAADSLAEISDPDIHVTFSKALRIADEIVEAYQQSWPKIHKLLDENRVTAKFKSSLSPGGLIG